MWQILQTVLLTLDNSSCRYDVWTILKDFEPFSGISNYLLPPLNDLIEKKPPQNHKKNT